MNVAVDQDKCCGAGTCVLLAPDVFDQRDEDGVAVAACVLGEGKPYTPVPYFWTDQFDAKIHVHGTLSADAEVTIVDGDPAERRFVATYRRLDAVTGVLGWNMPKQARLRRQEVRWAMP